MKQVLRLVIALSILFFAGLMMWTGEMPSPVRLGGLVAGLLYLTIDEREGA